MNSRIFNFVLPESDFNTDSYALYFRANNENIFNSNKKFLTINQNEQISFDTYFNIFDVSLWKRYTNLNVFKFYINFKGTLKISLYEIRHNTNTKEIEKNILYDFTFSSKSEKGIEIPYDIAKSRNVFFTLTGISKVSQFYGGFITGKSDDDADDKKIIKKSAIIITTFKRESYLYKNLARLDKYFHEKNNTELKNFFDVFIIDNGNTLIEKDLVHYNFKIILKRNKNTGGAGGFARGMIESIESNIDYRYSLLMDDDIEINLEALRRTYGLMKNINNQYKDSFIGGAMFRSDSKFIQVENKAEWLRYKIFSHKKNRDLRMLNNVLDNQIFDENRQYYQAWWYCGVPAKFIRKDNLPIPFFIRMDDVEFSLRNNANIITMNGISVWHEPFETKKNPFTDYYLDFRNRLFLTQSISNSIFSSFLVPLLFFRHFLITILVRDYQKLKYTMEILREIKNGESLVSKDIPEKMHDMKNLIAVDEIETGDVIRTLKTEKTNNKNIFLIFVFFITAGGHLLPRIFMKKRIYLSYSQLKHFDKWFYYHEIAVYNTNKELAELRKISLFNALKSFYQMVYNILFIFWKSFKLKKQYKEEAKYYKVFKFWKSYLNL